MVIKPRMYQALHWALGGHQKQVRRLTLQLLGIHRWEHRQSQWAPRWSSADEQHKDQETPESALGG